MAYTDTGLGWYLEEDYLITLGSQTLGTVESANSVVTRAASYEYLFAQPGDSLRIWRVGSTSVGLRLASGANVKFCAGSFTIGGRYFRECYFMYSENPFSVTAYDADSGEVWGTDSSALGKLTQYGISQFSGLDKYGFASTGNSYQQITWYVNTAPSLDAIAAYFGAPLTVTHTITKVQGGAGAFAIVSYPHDGDTVYVGVGISSIPNPNSAATVAVDGTNGSYNTFNREGMQFTMFYTEQLTGELTANVPVITLDSDISGLPGVYEPRLFLAVAEAAEIHVGEYDPYSGAGESEPGAEEATFDFDSTAIDFGTPPTVTAAGMVELYIPSTTDLASLAQYLWAGSFDPDNFKKLFADPMDAIIGLQIVPVTATEIGTTPDTLYVGNISTGLSMPKASRQYVPVDCGSLTIPRRLGSYLDYSPHTEMQLYLPYIGFVDISPDDCMGGTVSVKYMVDIIGGTCVAQVKCNNHVLYEYAAACSCQVPVSAGQYQNIVLGAARGGVALVSGILGAAGGGLFSGLSEAADAAMSMTKPKIQRSGGFGGSSGLMGHQTPYIIYTVPRLIVPGRQNNFIGYPSYITRTLGDLTGYTQIDSIHLTGIPASQSEQAEIEQLLQEGVYL